MTSLEMQWKKKERCTEMSRWRLIEY
jgi:hypothetical protein